MKETVAYHCAVFMCGVADDTEFGSGQDRVNHVLGNALLGHPPAGMVTVGKLHPQILMLPYQ